MQHGARSSRAFSGMKRKRCCVEHYHTLYNDVFASPTPYLSMRSHLERVNIDLRPRALTMVWKMLYRQTLGLNLRTRHDDLEKLYRRAELAVSCRVFVACRTIQRHVLHWLWRPHGKMFVRTREALGVVRACV